jgi:hypothetical protein
MIEWALALALGAGTATPSKVVSASDEDCAIFAELGRSHLNWNSVNTLPVANKTQYRDGIYSIACKWAALGVTPPLPKTPATAKWKELWRPSYSAAMTAAHVVIVTWSIDGPSSEYCDLDKRADRWVIRQCGYAVFKAIG